jgi:hypothetical protein
VLRSSLSLGRRTLQPYWLEVAYSFNCMFYAMFPRVDRFNEPFPANSNSANNAGKELASGFAVAVTEFRGDWKWHKEIWAYRCGWMNNCVCSECKAMRVGQTLLFTDVSITARWRTTLRTQEEFMNDVLPSSYLCLPFAF